MIATSQYIKWKSAIIKKTWITYFVDMITLEYDFFETEFWTPDCQLFCHVAALLTLKANWFDTLTVKQLEIIINHDVLLLSATNEETPYEKLLHYLLFWETLHFFYALFISFPPPPPN